MVIVLADATTAGRHGRVACFVWDRIVAIIAVQIVGSLFG